MSSFTELAGFVIERKQSKYRRLSRPEWYIGLVCKVSSIVRIGKKRLVVRLVLLVSWKGS